MAQILSELKAGHITWGDGAEEEPEIEVPLSSRFSTLPSTPSRRSASSASSFQPTSSPLTPSSRACFPSPSMPQLESPYFRPNHRLISIEKEDPSLGTGWAFFVEDEAYCKHVLIVTNQNVNLSNDSQVSHRVCTNSHRLYLTDTLLYSCL
jgi:hypothetical protein